MARRGVPRVGTSVTKKKRIDTAKGAALSSNPFAGLAGMRASLTPSEEPGGSRQTDEPSREAAADESDDAPPRAVIRYSRKGRGGKEVTMVEHLGLPNDTLETWLRELKKVLGVGGYLENGCLYLSGDQRGRLPSLLGDRGVKKITVS
jgi:translation initiation factor 1